VPWLQVPRKALRCRTAAATSISFFSTYIPAIREVLGRKSRIPRSQMPPKPKVSATERSRLFLDQPTGSARSLYVVTKWACSQVLISPNQPTSPVGLSEWPLRWLRSAILFQTRFGRSPLKCSLIAERTSCRRGWGSDLALVAVPDCLVQASGVADPCGLFLSFCIFPHSSN
jgi:hypothetical protein